MITVFREPLMKAEKEEFERLISDASYHIVCDPHVRKAAALELKYVPGKEREFLDGLNMLLETFDGQFQDEARESARLLEEKRRQELERGQQKLDAGQVDAARAVFSILARENQENYELRVDIGERFLRAGEYEDAVQYLGEALEGMPRARLTSTTVWPWPSAEWAGMPTRSRAISRPRREDTGIPISSSIWDACMWTGKNGTRR